MHQTQQPTDMKLSHSDIPWKKLAEVAWCARENAHIIGKTKVGAAALSDAGRIFGGCNVEQVFRSHDIHAEVNAIGNMVASGDRHLVAILVVAERNLFTPCGGCMDWIMQFGQKEVVVGFQKERNGEVLIFTGADLMPHYPS